MARTMSTELNAKNKVVQGVEAFGHVSARLRGGGFLITPTSPLLDAVAGTVITVDDAGTVIDDPANALPLETPLHAAIYRVRRDVGAICRGHGPAMVAWGVEARDAPLLHGLGAIAGVRIPVHPDFHLIASTEAGEGAAATLGPHHAVLLRANGGLAVGADLIEAATRLWFLEERARVALAAAPGAYADIDWEHRLTHTGIELGRAKAWFAARFGTPDPNAEQP